ncbi:MAG TPA: Na+/H+ antiporter NhaA [Vicinamibacterales bacterium]|nr:Na+/H+ antiporter NhaA [Vicinamibacterales bacterium]
MRALAGRVWAVIAANSGLLIGGTLFGLLWANLSRDTYEPFAHALEFAVNDVGMVFFFALATKEIVEAMLPGGALSSPREAALPVLAACGGMLMPALLYLTYSTLLGRPDLHRGWAIPCATDIAFSYLAARFIFPREHPAIPFLLLLAIADDALGLVILALFYPARAISFASFFALMTPALVLAWMFRRRRVHSFWPYVAVAGSCSWVALYLGGFHPALALVAIVPFMPAARRDLGVLAEGEPLRRDTLSHFEEWWNLPVQVVLFFFGLVNAGVPLTTVGAATWMVLSALLLGKPLGILMLSYAGVVLGLRLPRGIRTREMVIVGIAAGIGFTVALFFATAAFPNGGVLLDEAKMGALLSFAAAPIAIGIGRLVGVTPASRWPR